MIDTFPGVQQDCLDVIKKCNALILAARTCRTDAIQGSAEGIRIQVQEMDQIAKELSELCATLNDTTDHLEPDEPDQNAA